VDAFAGRRFEGTINQIRLGSQTVQNVVTYSVVIDVANRDLELMPGMTANLTFAVAERTGVLKVPNAALRFVPQGVTVTATQGSSGRVWVPGPDKSPLPRTIELGITDGVVTEVTSGELREGELVIVGQQVSGSTTTRSTGGTRIPGLGGGPR
jgi:HlyD family secretion protein